MTEREEVAKQKISRELSEEFWPGHPEACEFIAPVKVWDALISREMRIREILAVLQSVNNGAPACDCDHSDENCCVAADEYCAYCISGLVLSSKRKSG